jgi:hypothetical protein
MKPLLKFALLVAIPLEVVNLLLAGFPLDTGFAASTHWYHKVIAYQWLFLHCPGVLLLIRLSNAGYETLSLRWIDWPSLQRLVLFVSGYLDTVLLILAVNFGFRRLFRHRTGRYPAS